MAGLLVSVRSVEEALAALAGRASVIDIKEPARGPLGRASAETWAMIRRVVPADVPLSIALGELAEFAHVEAVPAGLGYQKLGLAGVGPDWRQRWADIRMQWAIAGRGSPRPHSAWVAVVYADWEACGAPGPDEVLEGAITVPECAGVLVDTHGKGTCSPLTDSAFWRGWVERVRGAGRFLALAGEINEARMERLAALRPDLFAVRGAACEGGDRRGAISADRVAALADAAARL